MVPSLQKRPPRFGKEASRPTIERGSAVADTRLRTDSRVSLGLDAASPVRFRSMSSADE
jgi:hypothetical protein